MPIYNNSYLIMKFLSLMALFALSYTTICRQLTYYPSYPYKPHRPNRPNGPKPIDGCNEIVRCPFAT